MFTLPRYQRFFKERLLRDELDTETQSFRWRATYIDSLYWGGMKVYKLLKLVYSISPTNNGILIILSLAETTSHEAFFYRYSTIFHRMNCNSWKRTSESFCDRGLVSFHLELSSMLNEFASRGQEIWCRNNVSGTRLRAKSLSSAEKNKVPCWWKWAKFNVVEWKIISEREAIS